jgi:hypothetical protein
VRPDDVRAWIHDVPFQPFRLHLTNGTSFDVRHPEQALVDRTTVTLVPYLASAEHLAPLGRDIDIALLHIV